MSKRHVHILLFITTLLLVCFVYYHKAVFNTPFGRHDWAQSDRLSLAMNFYDEGMDFFSPRTYNMFSEDRITGVEFPLQAYLSAALGHIAGRDKISCCFRLLDLSVVITGLLFLFLAVYKRTKDIALSSITPLFIFSSPVFAFYAHTYLPDAVAAGILFIAFYFINEYISVNSKKYFLGAIALLGLAALVKTSTVLYLCGFVLYLLLSRSKNETRVVSNKLLIAAVTPVLIILSAQVYYIRYLNEHSGCTIFLAKPIPFTSLNDISYYFTYCFWKKWKYEYMLPLQYIFIVVVLILSFTLRNNRTNKLVYIFFVGSIMTALLFGKALFDHDYYVVSIFIPAIAYFLITFFSEIGNPVYTAYKQKVIKYLSFSMIVIMVCQSFIRMNNYFMRGNVYSMNDEWQRGGAKVLEQLRIPKHIPIFAFDEDAPNTSFVFFDRTGYNMNHKWWYGNLFLAVKFMKEKDLDIMVCDARKINMLQTEYADIYKAFQPLYTDTAIAVFALKYDNDTHIRQLK